MTDKRAMRAELNREQRRAQILATALTVFAEQGYHRASITDVVKAAGVARGTFYLYFDSKEAIFLDLLDDLVRTLRSSVAGMDLSPQAAPMREQLHRIVVRVLETAKTNEQLTRIIFREAVGVDAAVHAKLQQFHDELHGWLTRALELGEHLGWIRPGNHGVAATCIVGTMRQVIVRYIVDGHAFEPDEVAAGIVCFNLDGLTAPSRR